MAEERLQKFMASAGVASRRKSEGLIAAGRVRVDGQVVTTLGFRVDPEKDRVEVDGVQIRSAEAKVYIVLNKPSGYVTTVKDEKGRSTVLNLVADLEERLFPVGRLDMDTEGLLLLTNDGDFAHLLMHPRHEIWKTYLAVVEGGIGENELAALRHGVQLGDGLTVPAKVRLVDRDGDSTVEISIREGRKRQVKRMFAAVGHAVKQLKRLAYGPLVLGSLKAGEWRKLSAEELEALLKEAKR